MSDVKMKCSNCNDAFTAEASTYDFLGRKRTKPTDRATRQMVDYYGRPVYSDLVQGILGRSARPIQQCPNACVVTGDIEERNLLKQGVHAKHHRHHLTDDPSKSPFTSLVFVCDFANDYLYNLRISGVSAFRDDNKALHPNELRRHAHDVFLTTWDAPRASALSRMAFYVAWRYLRWCHNCSLPFILDALYYFRHRPDVEYSLLRAIIDEILLCLALSPKPNKVARKNQFLILRELAGMFGEHGASREAHTIYQRAQGIEERKGIDEEAVVRREAMSMGLSEPSKIRDAKAILRNLLGGIQRSSKDEFLRQNMGAGVANTLAIFSFREEASIKETVSVYEHLVEYCRGWTCPIDAPFSLMTAQNFFHAFLFKGLFEAQMHDCRSACDSLQKAFILHQWLGLPVTGEVWPGMWDTVLKQHSDQSNELVLLLAHSRRRSHDKISRLCERGSSTTELLSRAGLW